jgi:hypothetical protein
LRSKVKNHGRQGLYLLLVTNKASNILEDLETLRLLAKARAARAEPPAPPSASAHPVATELRAVAGCREGIRRPPRMSASSERPVMPVYCPGSAAPHRRMLAR